MAVASKSLPGAQGAHAEHHEDEHDPRQYLMYDPKPRGEMNQMVMESMTTTSWKFWVVFGILSVLVATCFFYAWGYMIAEGAIHQAACAASSASASSPQTTKATRTRSRW